MVRWGGLLVLALALAGCGDHASAIRLTATPRTTLIDQTVRIRVTGAKPGSLLTLQVRQTGWAGRGVYRVAGDGTVDPSRDASLAGTYTGRHAMGLFWSMAAPPHDQFPDPFTGGTQMLTAQAGEKIVASVPIDRRAAAPGVAERPLRVARNGFYGEYEAPPQSMRRGVPVVVFGGSEGGLSTLPDARLYASHGHPALALAYFDEPGLPADLDRIPLEYFVKAVHWLDRQPGVDASRLVVSGSSRGSEAALELALHFPRLVHGVIALVPSSQVNPAVLHPDAAWTLHGRALAYTGTAANIPVDRIHAPVLVAGGELDAVWPSYYYVKDIAERDPRVTAYEYANAGHFGTPVPNLPWQVYLTGAGGTPAGNSGARADLFPKILRFLAGA